MVEEKNYIFDLNSHPYGDYGWRLYLYISYYGSRIVNFPLLTSLGWSNSFV